jgi:peptidoglycan/xylan/chitin deacetylase (PgdA/CDA1 family)
MTLQSENDRIPLSVEVRLGVFFLIFFLIAIILSQKNRKSEDLPKIVIEKPISSVEIVRGDRSKMNIIFTFDGGSTNISGEKILDVLARHNMQTSFFLTGDFVAKYPNLVKRMALEGHEIYNHTQNHPHLTLISDHSIVSELDSMENELQNLIGSSSKPYFRPPYGDRDRRVLDIAYGAGYRSVLWTVDALDWQESEGRIASEVRNIILSSLAPGNIYLLHLGDNISGNLLEEMINEISKKGYKIVSLKQGL